MESVIRRLEISPKIIRYIISGGTATVANLLTVYLLTDWLGLYYLASSISGFILAVAISFILQKFWTFGDHSQQFIHWQALAFGATAVGGLLLNTLFVHSLVEYIGWHYLLAQIISGVVIATLNFLVYQKLVFST